MVGEVPGGRRDPAVYRAAEVLRRLFQEQGDRVFATRHLEVANEDEFFHWVTERAVKVLAQDGVIRMERVGLSFGATMNIVWRRQQRYVKRAVAGLVDLVERYSAPEFTAGLGAIGELLVSDGLARFQFKQLGQNVARFEGREWLGRAVNLDLLVSRDGRTYGVEVKNTLPYIDRTVLEEKLELCRRLGVIPLFVVRAAPRVWVHEVEQLGGFTLILRHWLLPPGQSGFARELRETVGLPAATPPRLYDGTIIRFLNWHLKRLGPGAVSEPVKPGKTRVEGLVETLKRQAPTTEEEERNGGMGGGKL